MPHSSEQHDPIPVAPLSEREATFVDRLLGEGSAGQGATPDGSHGEALRRIRAVFEALAQSPAPPPPADLAARTLARIRREKFQLPAGEFSRGPARHFRLGWDARKTNILVMAAAACVLLAIIALRLVQARTQALRTTCAANLVRLAGAFGQYAAANENLLPEIAPPHDRNWLPRRLTGSLVRSPDAHSNLANLMPLVRGRGRARYVSWNRLVCPACPRRSVLPPAGRLSWRRVNYSYLDQLSPYHYQWNGSGHIVVLADSNPLFAGRTITSAQLNSYNHGGAGQNILYNNGSVRWTMSPNVGPDHHNIWTIGNSPQLHYTGWEEPTSPNDIILVP